MYDTRFKGSFKAVPIYVYKSRSIRKRILGLISCNTTTHRSLQPIPLNWVPLELLQGSDSSYTTIAPHWSSSYPEYLSPDQDQEEQRRVVWTRLHSHRANLASRLSKQKEWYLALCQELNPRMTQVESSHDLLYRDRDGRMTGLIPHKILYVPNLIKLYAFMDIDVLETENCSTVVSFFYLTCCSSLTCLMISPHCLHLRTSLTICQNFLPLPNPTFVMS